MAKPTILTAPRVSSELHIGNYFGAILPMVDMAKNHSDEYQINLFVADLHGITTPIDYTKVMPIVNSYLKIFVATGMPIKKPDVHIYRQSYIPAHSELAWILECFTGFGEMRRMTQFKEKSQTRFIGEKDGKSYIVSNKDVGHESEQEAVNVHVDPDDLPYQYLNVSVGLFSYPILMAADILLYGASYVPVGDDQSQHLEFTRNIGQRMNNRFGELFVLPKPVGQQHEFFGKDQALRIMDLAEPTKKMSKSDETGKGVIFLNDSPEVARKKVMSGTTDDIALVQYDTQNQPGISNLLQIYGLLKNKSPMEAAKEFAGQTQYVEFKKIVASELADFLTDFQTKLKKVNQAEIDAKLIESETAMKKIANETLLRVQKAVGLRP